MPRSPVPLQRAVLLLALFLLGAATPAARIDAAETGPVAAAPLPAEVPPDAALEQRIQDVFSQVEEFADIEVEVRDGVVHLSGKALRSRSREQAGTLASRFEGVLYVNNDIQEETDVANRLTPAVDKLRDYVDNVIAELPLVGVALLVVALFWLLAYLSMRWEAPYDHFGVAPLLRNLLRRLLATAIVLLGVLLALDILDITTLVGALLGTAGVFGLAMGFAFGDIVQNYLAGAILSVRQPFAINDHIAVGQREGRVLRLTSRELILMTLEGNHLRIPNAEVFKTTLCNFTRNPRRRFDFTAGIDTAVEPAEAQRVGVEVLEAMQGVLDDPAPYALVDQLGDSTVVIRYFGWIDQTSADYFKVRSEAIRLAKGALDAAGIGMPEPAYRVRLLGDTAAAAASPEPTEVEPRQSVPQADVSVDDQLEGQIREDLASSDEGNLLEPAK